MSDQWHRSGQEVEQTETAVLGTAPREIPLAATFRETTCRASPTTELMPPLPAAFTAPDCPGRRGWFKPGEGQVIVLPTKLGNVATLTSSPSKSPGIPTRRERTQQRRQGRMIRRMADTTMHGEGLPRLTRISEHAVNGMPRTIDRPFLRQCDESSEKGRECSATQTGDDTESLPPNSQSPS
jgi:hypothetical protein